MLPPFRRNTQLDSLRVCVCVCAACVPVLVCTLCFCFSSLCARSRKLNTTLLLTRLPELNSGQKFAKNKKILCQLVDTVPATGYGMRTTATTTCTQSEAQSQHGAQLHMSKLNGFRLPADNKNACFHITNMLYASLMLLRFTNIFPSSPSHAFLPSIPCPCPISSPFLCENFR